jgi:hypothetical protein
MLAIDKITVNYDYYDPLTYNLVCSFLAVYNNKVYETPKLTIYVPNYDTDNIDVFTKYVALYGYNIIANDIKREEFASKTDYQSKLKQLNYFTSEYNISDILGLIEPEEEYFPTEVDF